MQSKFPRDWAVSCLGSLAKLKGGKRLPKGATYSDTPTPFRYIRVSDFANGSVDVEKVRFISKEISDAISRYTISSKDLYISIAGTLGVVGIVPDELDCCLLTENAAKIVLTTNSLDLDFLMSVMQSNVGQSQIALGKGVGGGVPKLPLFRISAMEIPVPPLPEQRKIAEILSSVDEAIGATQAVIEQTRRVKEGLLQELLTKGIGHTRFKKTAIGEIPESWSVESVSAVCSIENTKRKPLSKDVRATMQGIYPYWGPTKIQDHINEFGFDGEYALVGEDGDHFLKWERAEMTKWATGRFNVNNHAHALGSTSKCRARWFFYYFLHRDLRNVLTRQGAGRYKLTKAALSGLKIAVPSIFEQDKIIERMDACRLPEEKAQNCLADLKKVKAGLLQDLLTGKVRVSV